MAAFDRVEVTKQSACIRPAVGRARAGRLRLACSATIALFAAVILPSERAMAEDKVLFALSGRHMETTTVQLEEMAGGQDQLVAKLLEYRTKETPPFVAIRSEKLLLNYAGRAEVQAALEQDVQSPQYKGLARTVAVHLDQVPDAGARQRLARAVVSRAKTESDFTSFAKGLEKSNDEKVREVAKTLTE